MKSEDLYQPDSQEQQILNYIREQLQAGYPAESIVAALVESRWPEEMARNLVQKVRIFLQGDHGNGKGEKGAKCYAFCEHKNADTSSPSPPESASSSTSTASDINPDPIPATPTSSGEAPPELAVEGGMGNIALPPFPATPPFRTPRKLVVEVNELADDLQTTVNGWVNRINKIITDYNALHAEWKKLSSTHSSSPWALSMLLYLVSGVVPTVALGVFGLRYFGYQPMPQLWAILVGAGILIGLVVWLLRILASGPTTPELVQLRSSVGNLCNEIENLLDTIRRNKREFHRRIKEMCRKWDPSRAAPGHRIWIFSWFRGAAPHAISLPDAINMAKSVGVPEGLVEPTFDPPGPEAHYNYWIINTFGRRDPYVYPNLGNAKTSICNQITELNEFAEQLEALWIANGSTVMGDPPAPPEGGGAVEVHHEIPQIGVADFNVLQNWLNNVKVWLDNCVGLCFTTVLPYRRNARRLKNKVMSLHT